MIKLRNAAMLLLLAVLTAIGCGQSLVEFPLGAPPEVTSTSPADGAAGVPVDSTVHATFSEALDPETIDASTFTLSQGATPISASVVYTDTTAILSPDGPLEAGAVLTATITTGITDLAGNAMADDYVWTFTTSATPDTTPPSVLSTDPMNDAGGVAIDALVHAAFSEAMAPSTIEESTFELTQGAMSVAGSVSYQGTTATFTPAATLLAGVLYTATITTGARDLAGNALASDYTWTFETGSMVGQETVNLGSASTFAILAFNTVTNVNNPGTIVTGDLGISPGAALVGFPPGEIIGETHAGDSVAATAKVDLLTAYNDAAGRPGAAVLPGDLSGLTFYPGLYKNSTSVMLSAGSFTLDAQGDENAVFIFQMGSTFTSSPGTQVVLSGGAKATNIYWSVGTSATLGTNSIFKGTILAGSAITMDTGATMEGRALALGAAVALDTNTITVPSP